MLKGGGVRGQDEANEAEQEEEKMNEAVEKEVDEVEEEDEVDEAKKSENIYLKETYGNLSLVHCFRRRKTDLINVENEGGASCGRVKGSGHLRGSR